MSGYRPPPHQQVYRILLKPITKNLKIKEIMTKLFACQLISQRDMEKLARTLERYGHIRTAEHLILEIMMKNPGRDSFDKFVAILRDTGQEAMADALEKELKKVLAEPQNGSEMEKNVSEQEPSGASGYQQQMGSATGRRILQIPDMSDYSLNDVALQIGHHWKEVGYSLGFTKAHLETIEYDNIHLIGTINIAMLIQWRQRQDLSEDQMINTLYSTFRKCGFEVESDRTIEKDEVQVTAPDKVILHIRDMSDHSLCDVAWQIGHHWKEVGYSLGFTKAQLETIEHDNPYDLINIITFMLFQWRQRQDLSEDQMINTLYSTFRKCGFEVESDRTIEKDEVQVTAPDKGILHIKDMSDFSLNYVAGQIGHPWKEVGYSLGFTKAQLETIEHDSYHLIDIITNMLIQWRQRQDLSEDQMINTLYSTFRKCGFEVESDRTIEWTSDEKKRLTELNVLRVLYIGQSQAGKTSLAQTILRKEPYVTKDKDRTVIADHFLWMPDEEPGSVFAFVDIGGHDSYRVSGHYFHCNSENNLSVFCHDLNSTTETAYKDTFSWVESTMNHSLKGEFMFLLTRTDECITENIDGKKKNFTDELGNLLDEKIQDLNTSLTDAKECKSSKTEVLQYLLDKYIGMKKSFQNQLLLTSCYHEDKVNRFKEKLITVSKKHTVKLKKETGKLLFQQIGKRGVPIKDSQQETKTTLQNKTKPKTQDPHQLKDKADNSNLDSKNEESDNEDNEDNKVTNFEGMKYIILDDIRPKYKQILKSLPAKSLSAESLSTESPSTKSLSTESPSTESLSAESPSTESPSTKSLSAESPSTESPSTKSLSAEEIESLSNEEIDEYLKNDLDELHRNGLLIYFRGEGELGKTVFHDVNFFVTILKCVFHHRTKEFLTKKEKDPEFKDLLRKHYNKKERLFDVDKDLLYEKGLMTPAMLQFLLEWNGCGMKSSVIRELLINLEEAAIPVGESNIFIPYFVAEMESSQSLEQIRYERDTLVVQYDIVGNNLPITLWHRLLVHVLKKITSNQNPEVWNNAMSAYTGISEGKIMLRYNNKDCIKVCMQAEIKDQEGHQHIWDFLGSIQEETDRLMHDWWPGLVTDKFIRCTGLVVGAEPCRGHNLETEMLLKESSYACGHVRKIPVALRWPLHKDDKKLQKHLKDAQDYINHRVEDANARVQTASATDWKPSDIKKKISTLFTSAQPSHSSAQPSHSSNSSTVVRLCTDEDCDKAKTVDHYKMEKKPRGVAVIINIEDDRLGSKVDVTLMTNLFQQLHFHVITYIDLTAEKIESTLKDISQKKNVDEETKKVLSNSDCFILFLMAHGRKDEIQARDKKYVQVDKLIEMFEEQRCDFLRNKPKLFFIQACRGGSVDRGIEETDDAMKSTGSVIEEDFCVIPTTANVHVAYASVDGYQSLRNEETGTWFACAISEVFSEHACRLHLSELLTKVTNTVADKMPCDKSKKFKQCPETKSRLRKNLYFFPGRF